MIEGREYFRFLAYSSGVFEGMDLMERALLDIIAQCDDRLTVTEAMSLADLASSATLHRKIDNLRKAGWITLEHVEGNRRTKYLEPTEKAWSEYVKLNFAVREANNVK
jgi:DNA-binding MarR family transcriptional regulator